MPNGFPFFKYLPKKPLFRIQPARFCAEEDYSVPPANFFERLPKRYNFFGAVSKDIPSSSSKNFISGLSQKTFYHALDVGKTLF